MCTCFFLQCGDVHYSDKWKLHITWRCMNMFVCLMWSHKYMLWQTFYKKKKKMDALTFIVCLLFLSDPNLTVNWLHFYFLSSVCFLAVFTHSVIAVSVYRLCFSRLLSRVMSRSTYKQKLGSKSSNEDTWQTSKSIFLYVNHQRFHKAVMNYILVFLPYNHLWEKC